MAEGFEDLSLSGGIEAGPFPAKSKQATGLVNGTQTEVSSVFFADKILITVSQGGRLSQWVRLPPLVLETPLA